MTKIKLKKEQRTYDFAATSELIYAFEETKNFGAAQIALSNGADPTVIVNRDRLPHTLLHEVSRLYKAARFEYANILQALIDSGADVNAGNYCFNCTPLHYAAAWGQLDIAEALIANGADVNALDRDGNPPTFSAIISGHIDILKVLIHSGADVFIANYSGETALSLAKRRDSNSLMTQFLQDKISSIQPCTTPSFLPGFQASSSSLEPNSTLNIENTISHPTIRNSL